jgi:hypothetical protein
VVRINLLPSYVFEPARIRTIVIIFVILLAIEGGVVILGKQSAERITAWYTQDAVQFATGPGTWKQKVDDQVTAAKGWTEKADKYTKYIQFFSNAPDNAAVKYANDVADVFVNASTTVGANAGVWYKSLTISGTQITLEGNIKGLLNFTHYYFKMKGKKFTVSPDKVDLQETITKKLGQDIPLTIVGTIEKQIPPAPSGFDEAETKDKDALFQGAAAPAASATATPPAGTTTTPPGGTTTTPPGGTTTTPPGGTTTTPPVGTTTTPPGGTTTTPPTTSTSGSLAPPDRGYR